MKKAVAVSFEEGIVKVVHASRKGQSLSVHKTETVAEEDFDNYLKKSRDHEFIVVSEFSDSFHGILKIPFIKSTHLKKIIESEIRKTTERKNFSFIYTKIGEQIIENKKILEVFYYGVQNDESREIVNQFYKRGKIVKALHPTVFSASSLLSANATDLPVMGILGTGEKRVAFMSKRGHIHFIRNYELFEDTLSDLDIQNINMTINYCFQNIRMRPESVILMGKLTGPSTIDSMPSVPTASFTKTDNIRCDHDEFDNFLLPISAFFTPKGHNVLDNDFKNIYMIRNYTSYASKAFALLALICLALVFTELKATINHQEAIDTTRSQIINIQGVYANYKEKEQKIMSYIPAVQFLNRPEKDFTRLFIDIADMNMKGLEITSIEASAKTDSRYIFSLEGTSSAGSFSSFQRSLENMLNALEEIEGIKISSKMLDINEKTFTIVMDYK